MKSSLFSRYTCFVLSILLTLVFLIMMRNYPWFWLPALACGGLMVLGIYDLTQQRHAICRNYPIIGRLRFFFEFIRPELRQYFLEQDNEEIPFSRTQRTLVYRRAKNEMGDKPFGTLLDVYQTGYECIGHSMRPVEAADPTSFRITIGGADCRQPYSASIFNISAMSFGALSANAIRALNLGAAKGNFYHDTGEGSISRYHRENNGDLVWELGSGYFGCRTADGHFDPRRFAEQAQSPQVKMIEIKLSQGAKPGHGGILPAKKVDAEIAATRGVPEGIDCISPASHSAFTTPLEMMHFIQQLRELSGGKPVGFKLCIGHPWEFVAIVKAMLHTRILPDFIVVDGKEGGTGAAPLELSNYMGMPLREGLLFVHNTLVGCGLRDQIKVGASGKIISAFDIASVLVLGADWVKLGARVYVRRRLHPVAKLPHQPLPDRRGDARSAAAEGAGGAEQGGARLPLPSKYGESAGRHAGGGRRQPPGTADLAPYAAPHHADRDQSVRRYLLLPGAGRAAATGDQKRVLRPHVAYGDAHQFRSGDLAAGGMRG